MHRVSISVPGPCTCNEYSFINSMELQKIMHHKKMYNNPSSAWLPPESHLHSIGKVNSFILFIVCPKSTSIKEILKICIVYFKDDLCIHVISFNSWFLNCILRVITTVIIIKLCQHTHTHTSFANIFYIIYTCKPMLSPIRSSMFLASILMAVL
jgi:hypothetical protein